MIVFFIVTLFVGTPAFTATTKGADSCSLTEFRCNDGACVSAELVCDGSADCADQSDETACIGTQLSQLNAAPVLNRTKRQSACRKNQWECGDGSCIFFYGKCDGIVDCPYDSSDETHALCRKNKCQSNWFRCTYGACVDGTAPCNGVQDCADGSDELLPRCRNEKREVRGQFTCADGSQISVFSLCDGVRDCADGSDETVRACAGKTCPSYLFQCAYGACVDTGADCNKTIECADGSDESEELCGTSDFAPAPNTTPRTHPQISLRAGKCVLPPHPEHGRYITNIVGARPGLAYSYVTLNVTCVQGYRVIGSASVSCQNGYWMEGTVPKCIRHCRLDPQPSVEYRCRVSGFITSYRACKNYEPVGTTVRPECRKPNYYSSDSLTDMHCQEGNWDHIAQCSPECGRVTPSGTMLVVGGHNATKGELPWHAAVYMKTFQPYMQICSGSLISSNVVLSAAHCFFTEQKKKQLSAELFAIAVGKIYRQWDNPMDEAQKSDVKEIHLTDHYMGSEGNYQDDIAVVIVVEPFEYKTFIRPVCLDFESKFELQQLQASNKGKVAGWGLTAENGKPASKLQVVDLPYVDVKTCIKNSPSNFREYLTNDKICAGSLENATALCQGDSGGGLAFPNTYNETERFYLRGVTSTAPVRNMNACNTFAYTSFTQITKHENFIKQYLPQA